MSDLLAPILVVMDDEADAFWCFACIMDTCVCYHSKILLSHTILFYCTFKNIIIVTITHTYQERNFSRDQNGMHKQLNDLRTIEMLIEPSLYHYLGFSFSLLHISHCRTYVHITCYATLIESIDALNFFFCFRWLLVLFKREFEFEDVLRLWEEPLNEIAWRKHFTPEGKIPAFHKIRSDIFFGVTPIEIFHSCMRCLDDHKYIYKYKGC